LLSPQKPEARPSLRFFHFGLIFCFYMIDRMRALRGMASTGSWFLRLAMASPDKMF
jgi:hypothetical protein